MNEKPGLKRSILCGKLLIFRWITNKPLPILTIQVAYKGEKVDRSVRGKERARAAYTHAHAHTHTART